MKILALQLKRIGDLVLTTPALAALRRSQPDAEITLMVADACADLLPAIEHFDRGIAFRRGRSNWSLWSEIVSARYDVCLDFTGNDRSAMFTLLSKAPRRITFAWVRKAMLRRLVYNQFVDSSVRERHTADHYLDLTTVLGGSSEPPARPSLKLPESATRTAAAALASVTIRSPFIVIHPGSARAEKYWAPERWAAVIKHLRGTVGTECVITGGSDPFEREHIARIQSELPSPCADLSGRIDLLTFAAVIAASCACLSCDTAAVHFAAAFGRPQIALFGKTNPFHWCPRHARAIVISAGNPEPLREFAPRARGGPMDTISTETVIRATDALLSSLEAAGMEQSRDEQRENQPA